MKKRNASLFYRFVCSLTKILFKILYRYKIYGLKNFISGGAILAVNHTSFFDPPFIASASPEEIHFLARKSLFQKKWFARTIRALNTHPVSGAGEDASVLKLIVRLLKEGKKVVLFPEGTRTGGRVGKLQKGIGFLSYLSQCPILPVYICGAHKIWGRGQRYPKLWGRGSVIFGAPIYPKDFAHLDKKQAMDQMVMACEKALKNMEAAYRD